MKKYLLPSILLLLFLIVVLRVYINRPMKSAVLPTPPPGLPTVGRDPVPALPDPLLVNRQKDVVFAGQVQKATDRKTLPVYGLISTEALLRRAATSFALKNEVRGAPKTIQTTDGTIVLWSSPVATIGLDVGRATLSFLNLRKAVAGVAPTTGGADGAVKKLLKENSLEALERLVSIESIESTLGHPQNATTTSEPRLIINYRIYVDGRYPLFTKTSRSPAVVAVVGEGNVVRSISIALTGLPGAEASSGLVVSPEETQKMIQGGKALLFSYKNKGKQVAEESSPPDFFGVNITSTSIGYLVDTKNNLMWPIYVLAGSTAEPTPHVVEYVVPATR